MKNFFPTVKVSKIVAIHNKDNKQNKDKYCQISLLPSISKVYENICHN